MDVYLVYTTYPVSLFVVSVHLLDIVFLFPESVPEGACGVSRYLRTMDASRQTDNDHEK